MYRIFLLFAAIVSIVNINYGTPLDDYVNKPGPVFSWKLLATHIELTNTRYILNMTSQQWFDGTQL
jgi:hypothetical protein